MRRYFFLASGVLVPLVSVLLLVVFAARPQPVGAQVTFDLLPVEFTSFTELEHEGFGSDGYMECSFDGFVVDCASATGQHDGGLGVLTIAPPPADVVVHGLKIDYMTLGTMGLFWKIHGMGTNISVDNHLLKAHALSPYLPDPASNTQFFWYVDGNTVGLPDSAPSGWGSQYYDSFHGADAGLDLSLPSRLRVRRDPDSISALPEEQMTFSAYWIIEGLPPTPTPIPPTPTPGLEPVYGWGIMCTFTTTDGVTETISANLLDNGSFEAGLSGWTSSLRDNNGNIVEGGVWDAFAIEDAPDGSNALYKWGFDEENTESWLYQTVYVNRSAVVVVGADVRATFAGSSPGASRQVAGHVSLANAWLGTLNTPSDELPQAWQTYEGMRGTGGGGLRIGVYAGQGEMTVSYDRVYAYLLIPVSGGFEMVCPYEGNEIIEPPPEEGTPTPAPYGTPLPTLIVPTVGALPTVDPGVGVTPLPTQCAGWSRQTIPVISQTLPGLDLCLQPQNVEFAPDGFFSGATFDVWPLATGLLSLAVGSIVIGLIRRR